MTARSLPRNLFLLALIILAGAPSAAADDPPPFVPVYRENFPDPFILPQGGEFLAYAAKAERFIRFIR